MTEESIESLELAVKTKGDEVRKLKGEGIDKNALKPHLDELLEMKKRLQAAGGGGGSGGGGSVKENKKNKKKQQAASGGGDREGSSKKQLAKESKKAAKKAAKESYREKREVGGLRGRGEDAIERRGTPVQFCREYKPHFCVATAVLLDFSIEFEPTLENAQPRLCLQKGRAICGDSAISRYITRVSGRCDLIGGDDPFIASQVDQWLDMYAFMTAKELVGPAEASLSAQAFLCGPFLTLADVALLLKFQNGNEEFDYPPQMKRWYETLTRDIKVKMAIKASTGLIERSLLTTTTSSSFGNRVSTQAPANMPPLEGAEDGKVVVRFPPEPSGYLHIGHVKACLTNSHYAERYHGKLIVRFDDTNPSKEKEEFDESIMADLAALKVKVDVTSRTSDHFDRLADFAKQAIKEGWAFMDDTPQDQMQAERMERVESSRRGSSVEENMKHYNLMLSDDPEGAKWCLRAKIDMSSDNGTMRDPVIYRQNLVPHLQTKRKYNAYPTYDFACPIVDSIEGVTHAMRTTEYTDRDEQYHWIINKLKLRPVRIHSFARMGFTRTVLSKRKLTWFVEKGLVDGWFDPRFPTVQGVLRRGVSVQALKDFIFSQGASRRITTMEWDKFWSSNKKQYEASSHRYMGVFQQGSVELKLDNGPPSGMVSAITVQLHPKNAEMGLRPVRISDRIWVEGADVATLVAGDDIRLKYWGNVKISNVHRDMNGNVIGIEGSISENNTPKGARIITWLAKTDDAIPACLVEFDYLITKDKLEENDNIEDIVNPLTRVIVQTFVVVVVVV